VHEISIDQNHLPIKTKILEKYSNSIKQQRPLKLSTLERSILLANDLPGISVKSYLAPSKTTVGAADLTIRVEDRKPYEGFFIYDNKVEKAYGPYQSTLGAVYNSPNLSDKLQFIGRISSQGTLKLAYLNYTHFTEKESYITIETQQVRARPPEFRKNRVL
jgi:hemolysin activation/secretion protein